MASPGHARPKASPREGVATIGRYQLYDVLGAGGMASVHLGRMSGSAGFTRFVAIKRLHPHLASSREFSDLFLDEARLAARLRHPNIVETLDVVREGSEVLIVMELVEGASLSVLSRASAPGGGRPAPAVISAIALGILHGLHAAHMAKAPSGAPLNIVHRDVSPQNVIVGVDGVPRVLDFGVARANGQLHATKSGEVRGKLAYMAPEHLRGSATQKSDIYAAGVVLWELLAGERLYRAEDDAALLGAVLYQGPRPVPAAAASAAPELAAIAARALSQDPAARFLNAAAMADAIERAVPPCSSRQLGDWVERMARPQLAQLRVALAAIDEEPGLGTARITKDPPAPAAAKAGAPAQAVAQAQAPNPAPHQAQAQAQAPAQNRQLAATVKAAEAFAQAPIATVGAAPLMAAAPPPPTVAQWGGAYAPGPVAPFALAPRPALVPAYVQNNIWLSLVMAGVHLLVMVSAPTLPAIILGWSVGLLFGAKSAMAGLAILFGYVWLGVGILWAPLNAYGLRGRAPWSRMSTLVYAALSIPTGVGAPYGVYALITLGTRAARDDFERR